MAIPTVFEIVVLKDGVAVFSRDDKQNNEPLVRVLFSKEIRDRFPNRSVEVARTMIEAGVQKIGDFSGVTLEEASLVSEGPLSKFH